MMPFCLLITLHVVKSTYCVCTVVRWLVSEGKEGYIVGRLWMVHELKRFYGTRKRSRDMLVAGKVVLYGVVLRQVHL
jgi:hypothetical protein